MLTATRPTTLQRTSAAFAAFALFVSLFSATFAAPADAAGTPDISLSLDVAPTSLHGGDTSVSATATQGSGPDAYNVSFVATLPAGVSLDSADPAPTTSVVIDATGETAVFWENVADLFTGASVDLDFTFSSLPGVYGVGSSVPVELSVYANSDPRLVPDFDPVAGEVTGDFTGWDTQTDSTQIAPFIVEKNAPDSLLRGVHDHKAAMSVTVTQSPAAASSGFDLVDYLPAGLEYLGCSPTDNSEDGTEEYPTAGRIDDTGHPALSDCVEPSVVETVQADPPGSPGFGTYTRLVWTSDDLGARANLAAGGSFTIDYAVAVPMLYNELFADIETPNPDYEEPTIPNPDYDPEADEFIPNPAFPEFIDNPDYDSEAPVCVPNPDFDSELPTTNPVFISDGDGGCGANPAYDSEEPTVNPEFIANPAADEFIPNPDYDPEADEFIPNPAFPEFIDNPAYDPEDPEPEFLYEPVATDGTQTANLDNNTGAPIDDEDPQVSSATASAVYAWDGTGYDSTGTHSLTAEDITLDLSASSGTIAHGAGTTWQRTVRTSEYVVAATGIIGSNNAPDGLCVLVGVLPCPAPGPGGTDFTNSYINLGPNGTTSNPYQTITQPQYSTGDPVVARDSWSATSTLTAQIERVVANDGSTATYTATGAGSAGQSASGISMGAGIAVDSGVASCDDGDGLTWDESAGSYHPGDRVCWRVTVTFPGDVDTADVKITDYVPAAFGITAVEEGSAHTAGTFNVDIDGNNITWDSTHVAAGGLVFEYIIDTTVTDPNAVDPGDLINNLAKVTHRNSDGQVYQLRDEASAEYGEAILTLDKTPTSSTGSAYADVSGDTATAVAADVVTFEVTVDNEGTQDTVDVEVWDRIDTALGCADVSNISDGGSCAGGIITWSGLDVDAGDDLTLTYDVTLPVGVAPAERFDNTAGVRTYDGVSNDGTTTFTFVPEDNIDPTQNPSANADPADDDAEIQTPSATITKSRSTSVVGPGNSNAQATIGETVVYEIEVVIPEGTTVYNAELVDPISARLDPVAGVTQTVNGGSLPPSFDWDFPTSGDPTYRLEFPAIYTNAPGSGDDIFVVSLPADVADTSSNGRGASPIPNTATFTWEDTQGSEIDRSDSTNTAISEPQINVTKSADASGEINPGQTIVFDIEVSNGSATRVSTAFETVAVDTVPEELIVLHPTTGDPLADEGDPDPNFDATWDADTRTITWDPVDIDPGDTVVFAYKAAVTDPLLASSVITNAVSVVTTSMDGDVAGERSASSPASEDYTASHSVSFNAPVFSLTKDADRAEATVGEEVTYTLTATIPASIVGYDFTILDALDADLVFAGLDSATCLSGCEDPGTELTATQIGPDTNLVGWFLGDIEPGDVSVSDRVFEIVYRAYPADNPGVGDGDTLDNSASFHLNQTDDIDDEDLPSAPPSAGSFDDKLADADETVEVVEPELFIDIDVDGQVGDDDWRRFKPGDVLEFTTSVANLGSASTAAGTEIVVDLPADLEDFTITGTSVPMTVTDGDHTDGQIVMTVDSGIDDGDTVSFEFEVTVPDLGPADDNPGSDEYSVTASIPVYTGVAEMRYYTENPTDVVTLEGDLAAIGGNVFWDFTGDGLDAGDRGFENVEVRATWFGPDGVVGGGDDEVFSTTTDANGDWTLANLPGGVYRVDLPDPTDIPGGLDPSYDLDDGLTNPDAVWVGTVAEDADRDDIDFGFVGMGSISGTVYFDQDRNGSFNGGEAPLGGVDIDLVWLGFDGTIGGGDDEVFSTTTAPDGTWSVGLLPAGAYQATVTSGPGAGFTILADADFDLDGDSANESTLYPLAHNEDLVGWDFSYVGSYDVSGRLYYDTDGDGTDNDGDDLGVTDVEMTVRWAGVDGTFDTADDGVFLTETDGDGNYLVEDLPDGKYRVTISGLIPTGVTVTENPDGDGTLGTVQTIAGASLTDLDWGLMGDTSLGDRVWFDRNSDGVQDPDESGVPGVELTVTYAGPNGTFGDADDETFDVTTGPGGFWNLTGIPSGEYRVEVVSGIPDGMTVVSDPDAGPADGQTEQTLADGEIRQDIDFGLAGMGILGDLVWFDADGDGTVSGTEEGLAGVELEVTWAGPDDTLDSADDHTFKVTTDADGRWQLGGMAAGPHRVEISGGVPEGMDQVTFQSDGGDSGSVETALVGGQIDLDQDFGLAGSGALAGNVFFDAHTPGVFDLEDPGFDAVDVTVLWAGPNGTFGDADDQEIATTTDAAGEWAVDNLPAGDFRVSVDTDDLPAALVASVDPDSTLDSETTATLTLGQTVDSLDFGYAGTLSVSGTVYVDRDDNGVLDTGDMPVAGQDVTLVWFGPDGAPSGGDDFTYVLQTDVNGDYLAAGLPAGDYSLTLSDGVTTYGVTVLEDPDGGTDFAIQIPVATNLSDLDFRLGGTGSLDGTVWRDVNADGVVDPTDTGLAGHTIEVVWAGLDGEFGTSDDVTLETTTDGDGTWALDDLPAGEYRTTVLDTPAGLVNTSDPDPDLDSTTTVTLEVGETETLDFGYSGSASLSGVAFWDVDGSDSLDDGEPVLPAVDVTATWAGPDAAFGTADDEMFVTSTDADGAWSLELLPSGEYRVSVEDGPGGFDVTFDTDGEPYTETSLTLADDEDRTDVDFAYRGAHTVGDMVFWDLDGDNLQGPAEPGISGVELTLTWPGMDLLPGTSDDLVVTTATAEDGSWEIPGLPSASFEVTVDADSLPEGASVSSDLDGDDPLVTTFDISGADRSDVDYPVVGDASLSGLVWVDANGDGVVDPGEAPVPDLELTVTWLVGASDPTKPDPDVEYPTVTVVTDSEGRWTLPNLPPGSYTISASGSIPEGYGATTLSETLVTLEVSEAATFDVGIATTTEIAGGVFHDDDRNGTFSSDEDPVADVTVELVADGEVVAQTISSSDGSWSFTEVLPGDYQVRLVADTFPDGFYVVSDPDGQADGVTSVTAGAAPVTGLFFGLDADDDGDDDSDSDDDDSDSDDDDSDDSDDDSDGSDDDDRLPYTGAFFDWAAWVALPLLLGAAVLWLVARRLTRREQAGR